MTHSAGHRRTSRERILDAAAELVSDVGSGHLTLDAVAERAGLSKGGLLYNFPSKDALLVGMIERLIEQVKAEKESLRCQVAGERNVEAQLSVSVALKTRCGKMKDIANGLLAASAENPSLLEPARRVIADEWQKLRTTSEDPDAAMIAWLAIEGLSSLEMHDLSPVSQQDREKVTEAIFRLLNKGIAV
jgi:AcrR family transcriptional regulator